MLALLSEVKFLTTRDDINIKDTDFGAFKYDPVYDFTVCACAALGHSAHSLSIFFLMHIIKILRNFVNIFHIYFPPMFIIETDTTTNALYPTISIHMARENKIMLN